MESSGEATTASDKRNRSDKLNSATGETRSETSDKPKQDEDPKPSVQKPTLSQENNSKPSILKLRLPEPSQHSVFKSFFSTDLSVEDIDRQLEAKREELVSNL